jgi:hypothetical protein
VKRFGAALVLLAAFSAIAAPLLAPTADVDTRYAQLNSPPTVPRLRDARGWRAPFIYPWRLVNRWSSATNRSIDRGARSAGSSAVNW